MDPPDAEPAPIMVCISSINRTGLSSLSKNFKTSFKRFSKSPLYFVPAINAAISSAYMVELLRILGTLLFTIR